MSYTSNHVHTVFKRSAESIFYNDICLVFFVVKESIVDI